MNNWKDASKELPPEDEVVLAIVENNGSSCLVFAAYRQVCEVNDEWVIDMGWPEGGEDGGSRSLRGVRTVMGKKCNACEGTGKEKEE